MCSHPDPTLKSQKSTSLKQFINLRNQTQVNEQQVKHRVNHATKQKEERGKHLGCTVIKSQSHNKFKHYHRLDHHQPSFSNGINVDVILFFLGRLCFDCLNFELTGRGRVDHL